MGRRVVAMDEKLAAVLGARLPGSSVTEVCRALGISRQSFYKYKRRFAEEGIEGLRGRSRRPGRSPRLISAELEDEIVRLRKELPLDNGAAHIRLQLRRHGIDPPATSTIHRALRRRGLVDDQPQKRPKASYTRFEWPKANDLWQIDATQWVLRGGRTAWILDAIDDHSRLVAAARAHPGPTGPAALDCFSVAVGQHGLPARVLTDGGGCFTGRRHRMTVAFELQMDALAIEHIIASPSHPQTCGKLERFHSTEKRWLAKQRRARDLAELQEQLDGFVRFYNNERPHSSLDGATPAERYASAERATPASASDDAVVECRSLTVDSAGMFNWGGRYNVYVGKAWSGTPVTVIRRDLHMWVFSPTQLIRRLTLDPQRSYQGKGLFKRGRPRHVSP